MEAYDLYDLNEYIRQVIALNFTEGIWINAEISQLKESRGQIYLDLIQKNEDDQSIIAKSGAVIWYKSYLFIQKKLGKLAKDILKEGVQIQFKAKVDFHEKFGLKLVIEDLNPNYTIGRLELERQEILERLKNEQLLDLNKEKELAPVIQKIAVISSETAAGYIDFMSQIETNQYGYQIQTKLFHTAVQGKMVENEVVNALTQIQTEYENYDCIIIIRGGGSKTDLSGFDNYLIAKSIAHSELPVLVGIGHEIDHTVIDSLAHHSLKTPTAVADYIIERNANFESEIIQIGDRINQSIHQYFKNEQLKLQTQAYAIESKSKSLIHLALRNIDFIEQQIRNESYDSLKLNHHKLDKTLLKVDALDPSLALARGYSLTFQNGKLLKSIKDLDENQEISTKLIDGIIQSKVIN